VAVFAWLIAGLVAGALARLIGALLRHAGVLFGSVVALLARSAVAMLS